MRQEYTTIINFFGAEWFNENWRKFLSIKNKYSPYSFASELVLEEISLHLLLRDVFKYQEITSFEIDFERIPEFSAGDYHLTHLGRDLQLLENEIAERGSHIKTDLLDAIHYDDHRFNLLVAAGYKLLGHSVKFVPSSREIKRADLLIDDAIYIESKRRNQEAADSERYKTFSYLLEKFMPLLNKKFQSLVVKVDVKGGIHTRIPAIETALSRKIWRNQSLQNANGLKIEFTPAGFQGDLIRILSNGGHFQEFPIFTRTEDYFIASDPKTRNVFMLNKDIPTLPDRILKSLEDANNKIKDKKKLMVYFDIGRGVSDWNKELSDHIYTTISTDSLETYPNIDAFVVCQTALQFVENQILIKPNFNLIGKISKIGGRPEELNMFGFQGHTGMDDYLLKEFLNPIPYNSNPGDKYIECPQCGNRIIGIQTNLAEGELLSEVKMPYDKCGNPMEMTVQEVK